MTKGKPTLKLEGRLVGAWVGEFEQSYEAASNHSSAQTVTINLSGVSYVDQRAASLLARLEREGAAISDCSDFIRQLLQDGNTGSQSSRKSKSR